jgi:hypothetical protein
MIFVYFDSGLHLSSSKEKQHLILTALLGKFYLLKRIFPGIGFAYAGQAYCSYANDWFLLIMQRRPGPKLA